MLRTKASELALLRAVIRTNRNGFESTAGLKPHLIRLSLRGSSRVQAARWFWEFSLAYSFTELGSVLLSIEVRQILAVADSLLHQ